MKAGILLIIGLLLVGCSSKPTREVEEIPAPEKWNQQLAQIEKTKGFWWYQLNDIQLNQLIDEAMRNSPDVLTAQSVIREARTFRIQSKGSLMPSVDASASGGHTYQNEAGTESYSLVLDASWEPDIFGSGRSALTAAEASEYAAKADYADTLVSLSSEVAKYYVALRGYQMQLEVTQASLQSWLETVQLTEMQQQAGLITQLDVEQAKRSYEQTVASIPTLKQNIIETQYQIAVLIGRQPQNQPNFLQTVADLPLSPASVFLPLPAEVLRQRPDVRAAEQRVVAAYAQTDAAAANRLPSFTLNGALGFSSASLSDLFSPEAVLRSLSASVIQNLFDGGQLKAQEQIQIEQEKQAYLSYQQVVLEALQETENALSALHNSRVTLEALQRALEASKREEQLALIQYEAGEINFSDVLDAQRTRLTLRQQYVEAQASELAQVITLSKATAGGWALKQSEKVLSDESPEQRKEG